jgi:hypothetical protein
LPVTPRVFSSTQFTAQYNISDLSTAAPHSLNDSFGPELAKLMSEFMGEGGPSGSGGVDPLKQAKTDLDNV